MKKLLLFALILLLSVSMIGCTVAANQSRQNEEDTQQTDESDKKAVENIVESFGKKLQEVSLLAPEEVLEKSMKESYGDFVTSELIEKWITDPMNAPGRLTSSPWPDRIEILAVEKSSVNEYKVDGEIIEVTSTEKAEGGIAAKKPITLAVKKIDNRWLINDVKLGEYK
ncbi:MAG TPA: hypothetical protein PLG67_07685 [Bacillota bacterium]|jgi:hypothetical protein|nr:hypothetical protein [Bacillota bacterium]HRS21492.1 hypothetical protein [Clostridia bacterium]HRU42338.1 hypothetical protein [Candidatus Diapherotrites archaeon]HQE66292.1 hypothetical protein [Bacillota bacterium]HQI15773.1 hypothetical protein [Bacillota bacterium]